MVYLKRELWHSVQTSIQEALSDLAPWIARFVRSKHRTNPMFLFLIVVYSFIKTVHLIYSQWLVLTLWVKINLPVSLACVIRMKEGRNSFHLGVTVKPNDSGLRTVPRVRAVCFMVVKPGLQASLFIAVWLLPIIHFCSMCLTLVTTLHIHPSTQMGCFVRKERWHQDRTE